MGNNHDEEVSSNSAPSHQFYLKYNGLLRDAAAAYSKKNYAAACKIYKQAFSLVKEHGVSFSDDQEEMLLVYMIIACLTESDNSDDLVEALTLAKKFKISYGVAMPAIYFLLATIQRKFHRFKLAENTINEAFAVLNTDLCMVPSFIPQTYDHINETNKSYLLKALADLKEECQIWHPPDAVCSYNECQSPHDIYQTKKEIFYSDPSFDGLVTVVCSKLPTACTFKYHPACWETLKKKLFDTPIVKNEELIGQDCLKPPCKAMIQLITLTGKDEQVISSTNSENIFSSTEKYVPTGTIKKQNGQHYNREPYRTNTKKMSPEIRSCDISLHRLEDSDPELKWRKEVLEERRKINFGFLEHNEWRNPMKENLPNSLIDLNPPEGNDLSLIQDFISKSARKNRSEYGYILKKSKTEKVNAHENETISSCDSSPPKARSSENSLDVPGCEIKERKVEDIFRKDINENFKKDTNNILPSFENNIPTWNFSNSNILSFDPYAACLTGKEPNSKQNKSNEQCLEGIFTNFEGGKTENASPSFAKVTTNVTNTLSNPQEESSGNLKLEEKNDSIFNKDSFLRDLCKDNSVFQKSGNLRPPNDLHASKTFIRGKDTVPSSVQQTLKSDVEEKSTNSFQIRFEKLPTPALQTDCVSSSTSYFNGLKGMKNENITDQCETKFAGLSTSTSQDDSKNTLFFDGCKSRTHISAEETKFNHFQQKFEQVDEKTKNSMNDSVASFFKQISDNKNTSIPFKDDSEKVIAGEESNSFAQHASTIPQVDNRNEKNNVFSEFHETKVDYAKSNNPFDYCYQLSLLQENNNKIEKDDTGEIETGKSTLEPRTTEVNASQNYTIKSKGITSKLSINFEDIRPPKASVLYKSPDTKTLKTTNISLSNRNPENNPQESVKDDGHSDKNLEGLGHPEHGTGELEKSVVEYTKAEIEQMDADAREENLKAEYDKLKQDFSILQRQLSHVRQEKICMEHNFEVLLKEKKKIENTLMEERQNFKKILPYCTTDVTHKNTELDNEIQVIEDGKFDFQKQLIIIQNELELTKRELKNTLDTNVKLENKASEFDAFKKKCFLMKKNCLKKNLMFQSLLNKSLIARHIDQCSTAISIFNVINMFLLRVTGFSMLETVEWSTTLNVLCSLNQFEQAEFMRLRNLLESQGSMESLAEMKLATPVFPPAPKPGLGEFIHRALENLSKFYEATYARIQSGVPLVQCSSIFNTVQYNNLIKSLQVYPTISAAPSGSYIPQVPIPVPRMLSTRVTRETVNATCQIIQDVLKIEEPENSNKSSDKVMDSISNQNTNEKDEICGNKMIEKANKGGEEESAAKNIAPDGSSSNEKPENTAFTHNSGDILKETSNSSENINSCSKKESKKNQKIKRITMNIDEVLKLLRLKFSGVFELDLLESVSDVRKRHNNTLSGLCIQDIVDEAEQFIWKRQSLYVVDKKENNNLSKKNVQGTMKDTQSSNINCGKHSRSRTRHTSVSSTSSKQELTSDVLLSLASSVTQTMRTEATNASMEKKAWSAVVAPNETWSKKLLETECIICLEPMHRKTEKTYTLMCKHTFHSLCIHDWFKQNQSCPNCRVHSTLDDEFPPLPY